MNRNIEDLIEKPSEIIERLREKLGDVNDVKMAEMTSLTRSAISQWSNDLHAMNTLACIKIAELMDEDPIWLIACNGYHMDEKNKEKWLEIAIKHCQPEKCVKNKTMRP